MTGMRGYWARIHMPVPSKFGNLYQDQINNTTVEITKMHCIAPKMKGGEKAVVLTTDCFSVLPAKHWYLILKSAYEGKRNDSICWALQMCFDDTFLCWLPPRSS
jgi:hypothetical protein